MMSLQSLQFQFTFKPLKTTQLTSNLKEIENYLIYFCGTSLVLSRKWLATLKYVLLVKVHENSPWHKTYLWLQLLAQA